MKKSFYIFLSTFLLLYLNILAYEKIVDFESHIDIFRNSKLVVTEKITVNAEGKKIRRGIYRDFPTVYKIKGGLKKYVPFRVLKVTKNGKPENYFTKSIANGVRVYIGKDNVFLKPGIYSYKITYETDNQLLYFEDFDEIYWNVTGNEWDFEIESARAYVTFEGSVLSDIIKYGGYTGVKGSTARDFQTRYDDEGNLIFYTTKKLARNEGFTIYLDFPKGYVVEPDKNKSLRKIINDNKNAVIIIAGLLISFLIVEKERLLLIYKENELPGIFEKFLPYAIALEVEDKWAEKIENILRQANIEYRPGSWYHGTDIHASTSSLSGLSASLSAAAMSAATSASSSGGAGGSSGGGGGCCGW
jgi:uncharacterized membrane protein YgcG